MLPFLKPKRETGLIIKTRMPDAPMKEESDEGEQDHGLLACARDLIRAIHAKDEDGVAAAFRAAFELLELEPHDEVSHEDQKSE